MVMTSTIKEDWRITLNKVLFFAALIIITIGITWLSIGEVPEPLAIWTPVILSVLYSVYTALKTYDPEKEGKFQWWWQKIGVGVLAAIMGLINRKKDVLPPPDLPNALSDD